MEPLLSSESSSSICEFILTPEPDSDDRALHVYSLVLRIACWLTSELELLLAF